MRTRNNTKTIAMIFLIVAVAFAINIPAAHAKDSRKVIKLRCIAGHPDTAAPWVGLMKSFFVPELKKRVLEETKDYDLDVSENYGGSVAALGECLESIESGIGDMGMVVWVFEMSKLHPQNSTWWFPFGPEDTTLVLEAFRRTWDKFPFLDEMLERYNQKRIALCTLPSYEFVTNFPIQKLEDMKGKRIAHGGPMVPWAEAIGCVGVQSRLNEAYTALQTGVYDGWMMEPHATVGFKLYEPAPYYTIAGLGAGIPNCITMNLDTWNKLPKEVQKIVIDVGKAYEVAMAKYSASNYYRQITYMATKGVTVRKLTKKEQKRFAAAMDEKLVANAMAKDSDKSGYPGSEMAKFYVQTLIDLGYDWPVVPTIK